MSHPEPQRALRADPPPAALPHGAERLPRGIDVRVSDPSHPSRALAEWEERLLRGSVRTVIQDLGDRGVLVEGPGEPGQSKRLDVMKRDSLRACGWGSHLRRVREHPALMAAFDAGLEDKWIPQLQNVGVRAIDGVVRRCEHELGRVPGEDQFWTHHLEMIWTQMHDQRAGSGTQK